MKLLSICALICWALALGFYVASWMPGAFGLAAIAAIFELVGQITSFKGGSPGAEPPFLQTNELIVNQKSREPK